MEIWERLLVITDTLDFYDFKSDEPFQSLSLEKNMPMFVKVDFAQSLLLVSTNNGLINRLKLENLEWEKNLNKLDRKNSETSSTQIKDIHPDKIDANRDLEYYVSASVEDPGKVLLFKYEETDTKNNAYGYAMKKSEELCKNEVIEFVRMFPHKKTFLVVYSMVDKMNNKGNKIFEVNFEKENNLVSNLALEKKSCKISDMKIARSEQFVLVNTSLGTIERYNATETPFKMTHRFDMENEVKSFCFSGDGNKVAVGFSALYPTQIYDSSELQSKDKDAYDELKEHDMYVKEETKGGSKIKSNEKLIELKQNYMNRQGNKFLKDYWKQLKEMQDIKEKQRRVKMDLDKQRQKVGLRLNKDGVRLYDVTTDCIEVINQSNKLIKLYNNFSLKSRTLNSQERMKMVMEMETLRHLLYQDLKSLENRNILRGEKIKISEYFKDYIKMENETDLTKGSQFEADNLEEVNDLLYKALNDLHKKKELDCEIFQEMYDKMSFDKKNENNNNQDNVGQEESEQDSDIEDKDNDIEEKD